MTSGTALLPPIGITGYAFALYVLVAVPLLAWRQKRKFDAGFVPPSSSGHLPAMAVRLIALQLFATFTIWIEGLSVPAEWPATRGWSLAGILTVIPLSFVFRRDRPQTATTRQLRTRSLGPLRSADLPLWILISALAGIAEELAWRGVLPELLARHGVKGDGPYVIGCLSFALAHLRYGPTGVLMTLLLGIQFQLIVASGDSLYPAMFLHAAINVGVGVAAIRRAEREKDLVVIPDTAIVKPADSGAHPPAAP